MKIFISTLLLFVSHQIMCQTSNIATARIFENASKEGSQISIVFDDGQNEIIPLKKLAGYGVASTDQETLIENQKTIQTFLKNMKERGFSITQFSSTCDAYIYTYIVFEKEL